MFSCPRSAFQSVKQSSNTHTHKTTENQSLIFALTHFSRFSSAHEITTAINHIEIRIEKEDTNLRKKNRRDRSNTTRLKSFLKLSHYSIDVNLSISMQSQNLVFFFVSFHIKNQMFLFLIFVVFCSFSDFSFGSRDLLKKKSHWTSRFWRESKQNGWVKRSNNTKKKKKWRINRCANRRKNMTLSRFQFHKHISLCLFYSFVLLIATRECKRCRHRLRFLFTFFYFIFHLICSKCVYICERDAYSNIIHK